VLTLIGLSAIGFSTARDFKWRSASSAVLGTSLLLYASDLLTKSAVDLHSTSWFGHLLAIGQTFGVVSFGIGVVASFLSQSTTAVALVAAVSSGSGLIGLNEGLLIVYGGNVGSTLARMLLTRSQTGVAMQVTRFQDGFKIAGGLLFVLLFYLESSAHVPLVRAFLLSVSSHTQVQLALGNSLLNSSMAILTTVYGSRLARVLARRWPASAGEDIAIAEFVTEDAMTDPQTAVDLFGKEQTRILSAMRHYLEIARPGGGGAIADAPAIHRRFLTLFREINLCYDTLVTRHVPTDTVERFSNVQGRQKLVELIEDSVCQLATAAYQARDGKLGQVAVAFIEALDFFLLSAADALASLDRQNARLLQAICSDRSETMIGLRNAYVAPSQDLSKNEKALLLQLTTLFERIVWMLQRFGVLLEQLAETEQFEVSLDAVAHVAIPPEPA
jgi:phosphate:Na+ symporter